MKKCILVVLFFMLAGCAQIGLTSKRVVSDNIFYSTSSPKIKVEVDDNLKFIGEKHLKNIRVGNGTNSQDKNYYIFAEEKNGHAVKGLTIGIGKISPGYWASDIFMNYKNKIIEGVVNLNGKDFIQIVQAGSIGQKTEKIILDNGLIPAGKVFVSIYGKNYGVDSNIQLKIIYWEDLSLYNERIGSSGLNDTSGWYHREVYTDKKESLFSEFLQKANKSFNVSDITDYDIADLNSNQTKIPNNIEKLKMLKKMKDDGLITEQEYNDKKKNILDKY